MARRAVQGYSEKSYYENTTFLGMIATNDPINEGYFKHFVNLDISDTSQSVTPRKGFLTTGLHFYREATYNVVPSLFFDSLKYGTIDPSAYSEVNPDYYYNTSTNILWRWDGAVWAMYEYTNISPTEIIDPTVSYYLADASLGVLWYVTVTVALPYANELKGLSDNCIIFKDANIGEYVVYDFTNENGYRADIDAYNVVNKLLPITQEILIDLDNVGVNPTITIDHDVKVEHIYDENSISKTLFKATVNGVSKVLSCYYRENAVNVYGVTEPANTLVFDIVNFNQHPTYDSSIRNIANENSIIPNPMQVVYTSVNRPVGHVSSLGLIYFQKVSDNTYPTLYVEKGINYNIIPHFDLGPAYIPLNDDPSNLNLGWAYRFDIWSTRNQWDYSNLPAGEDVVFRSPWFKYRKDYSPEDPRVFPTYLDSYVQTGEDKTLYHYKGTTKVITLIPNDINCGAAGVPGDLVTATMGGIPPDTIIPDTVALQTIYDNWKLAVDTIEDTRTLKQAISTIGIANDTLFYVHDMQKNYSGTVTYAFSGTVYSSITGFDNEAHIDRDEFETFDDYNQDNFLTAEQLIDLIETGYFKKEGITFRYYPASVLTNRTASGLDHFRIEFWGLDAWDTIFINQDTLQPVYNKFHYSAAYSFELSNGGSTYYYTYGTTTNTLKYGIQGLPDFVNNDFFNNGYHLRFYIRPYDRMELYEEDEVTIKSFTNLEMLKVAWDASAFQTDSFVRQYAYDQTLITNIPTVQLEDPQNIQQSNNMLMFEDNRLVVWNKNIVYLSEPGRYYYFKEANKFSFSEKILKVIEYKGILLVFSTQHLYAIHLVEETSTSMDGDKPVTMVTTYWAKHRVLYNILIDEKYLDVVQVFNDFILFYSADGQMYLIKPNTVIDNDTRFTLKYFNKAVNDILQNYDEYINERLANYNIDQRITKDDVTVKSLISVNFIKVFYYVPGIITYILVYDVINNRYYTYDTTTFTDIIGLEFVDSGNMYITRHTDNGVNSMYFTMPYPELSDNCDMTIVENFNKAAISCLLDTGNLNLNNHLRKRFRDLHVVFKNLSATQVLYNVETMIDDIVDHPFYDEEVQVIDVDGTSYYMTVQKTNNNDLIELVDANQISDTATSAFLYALDRGLFENHNILLDLSDYNASKLITHKSSILGMGKVVRLKLQFISKGKYKIQRFGIVYKERRI